MEPERQECVEVPGGHLWTVSSGCGVPLVLCHGGPVSYDYLAPVAELVDDVAEVHRFDQRGGVRSAAGSPWTLQALIDDVEALRRHWRHERWVVAGHSWGAHLALFTRWRIPSGHSGSSSSTAPGCAGAGVSSGVEEPALSRLRDLWWLTDFADRRNAIRSPRFADYPTDPSVLAVLERDWQLALDGIDEKLVEFTLPALVLHGEADPIGERGPRELASLLPRGRFVTLNGVGHLPWLEDHGELRHHLRTFVAEWTASDQTRADVDLR